MNALLEDKNINLNPILRIKNDSEDENKPSSSHWFPRLDLIKD